MRMRHAMAFALMVALAGCADLEPPIDVETYDEINRNFNVRYVEVHITSTTDKIEIQDVIVNRGNCKVERLAEIMGLGKTLPRKLAFGQSAEFSFSGPCTAKQVDVITDLGEWTWEY
jgi:hypothetical protein